MAVEATKNKIVNQGRQGDIYIWRIDLPTEGLKKRKSPDGVNRLVYGEVTGNTHGCLAAETTVYDWDQERWNELLERNPQFKDADNFFPQLIVGVLVAKTESSIRHDEHFVIPIAEGTYLVTRQREGDELNPRIVVD